MLGTVGLKHDSIDQRSRLPMATKNTSAVTPGNNSMGSEKYEQHYVTNRVRLCTSFHSKVTYKIIGLTSLSQMWHQNDFNCY